MNKRNVLKSLNKIMDLPSNWDSYKSPKFDMKLYVNSFWVVRNLPNYSPTPWVVPPCGSQFIQFEWVNSKEEPSSNPTQCLPTSGQKGKELELGVYEDKIGYLKVEYKKEKGEAPLLFEGEFKFVKNKKTIKKIQSLIDWLLDKEE